MKKIKNKYPVYSTFDIGHSFINGENIIEQFKILKENNITISTLHIHNNNGESDSHLSIDKGIINYKEIINYILGSNLNPIFIIEHWRDNLISYGVLKNLMV